jgi:hypothetical protein
MTSFRFSFAGPLLGYGITTVTCTQENGCRKPGGQCMILEIFFSVKLEEKIAIFNSNCNHLFRKNYHINGFQENIEQRIMYVTVTLLAFIIGS